MDIVYSSLTLKQDFPWSAITGSPATPDGEFRFEGDGWGLGGFASLRVDLTAHQRLTLTGHLPMTIDYDGEFKAGNLPAPLQSLGFTATSSFTSRIRYPGKVSLGYGIDITEDVTTGIDFEWADNSVHQYIPLDIGNDQPLLGTDKIVLNWHDSVSIGTGMEWRPTEQLALRMGYLFTETSMPDFTFTPAVASNDRHIFSAGVGYKGRRESIDFAYSFVRMEDRDVMSNQQPRFVGEYTFNWHIFTLSYRHAF
jgi:long-chain fatty acid transport protein